VLFLFATHSAEDLLVLSGLTALKELHLQIHYGYDDDDEEDDSDQEDIFTEHMLAGFHDGGEYAAELGVGVEGVAPLVCVSDGVDHGGMPDQQQAPASIGSDEEEEEEGDDEVELKVRDAAVCLCSCSTCAVCSIMAPRSAHFAILPRHTHARL
jgi:hypothetical protein